MSHYQFSQARTQNQLNKWPSSTKYSQEKAVWLQQVKPPCWIDPVLSLLSCHPQPQGETVSNPSAQHRSPGAQEAHDACLPPGCPAQSQALSWASNQQKAIFTQVPGATDREIRPRGRALSHRQEALFEKKGLDWWPMSSWEETAEFKDSGYRVDDS